MISSNDVPTMEGSTRETGNWRAEREYNCFLVHIAGSSINYLLCVGNKYRQWPAVGITNLVHHYFCDLW